MRGNITRRGAESFRVTVWIRDPVTHERQPIRRTVRGTEEEAERKLTEILRELDQGIATDPGNLTVGEYLTGHWLPEVRTRVEAATADRYDRACVRHLMPALGSVKLRDLRPLHVQRMVTDKLSAGRLSGNGGLGRQTVRDLLTVLSSALAQAVRWQLLAANPAAAVRPPRAERSQFEVVDPELARRILAAVKGTDLEAPVTLAIATGLRRGEILGLRWADVDMDAEVLRVRQSAKVSGGRYYLGTPKTPKSVARCRSRPSRWRSCGSIGRPRRSGASS